MTISKVTCSEPKPLTPANNKQQKKKGILLDYIGVFNPLGLSIIILKSGGVV
jgi:hypothetical protein